MSSRPLPSYRLCLVWLPLLFALLCGCSGSNRDKEKTGTVSGTITLDGKPFSDGVINFYDAKQGTAAKGVLQDGGRFTLDAPLPVGTYSVTVLPPEMPAPQIGAKPKAAAVNIPEKYRTNQKSDLTAEVKEGENSFKFEMNSK
jgi:hypothetical protein